MVRANLSAAVAIADVIAPNDSPTPAERVEQLGEFIEKDLAGASAAAPSSALKIHHDPEQPAAERLRIPFAAKEVNGFVFVRVDSEPTAAATYEAAVFFNGSCVSSVGCCPTRIEAITTVESDLYRMISRTETFREEARELNAIIHALRNLSEGEVLPKGEACEWPIAVDEEADTLPPPAAGLAGGGEVAAEPVTEAPTEIDAMFAPVADDATAAAASTEPEPTPAQRLARIRLAYSTAVERWKADCDVAQTEYIEASLARLEADTTLKALKSTEKEKLAEVGRVLKQHPRWETFEREDDRRVVGDVTTVANTTAAPSTTSTLPPPEPEYNAATPTSPQAVSEANSGPSASTALTSPPTDPDAWKSTDISAIGLPPKLEEKLRDAGCPTIGKLESLRGSFDGLKSIDGIGQAKADTIEEALLGWLSKNRDASTLSAAREAAVAGEAVGLEMAAQGHD